jgi:hypothetical protein
VQAATGVPEWPVLPDADNLLVVGKSLVQVRLLHIMEPTMNCGAGLPVVHRLHLCVLPRHVQTSLHGHTAAQKCWPSPCVGHPHVFQLLLLLPPDHLLNCMCNLSTYHMLMLEWTLTRGSECCTMSAA